MTVVTDTHTRVVDSLRQVVADCYALLGQTQLCHWNVEGPSFFTLHTAFEEQYTELFTAVDEIAERIRALGAYSPGGLANLAQMAGFEEIVEDAPAKTMVEKLIGQNKLLIAHLAEARDAAGSANDKETEDLMIARIQVHEKTCWMLGSYLKG
ncbi:MAG: DNA starvation/stationary phase protection protein [Verrucomicrobiota bacterium]